MLSPVSCPLGHSFQHLTPTFTSSEKSREGPLKGCFPKRANDVTDHLTVHLCGRIRSSQHRVAARPVRVPQPESRSPPTPTGPRLCFRHQLSPELPETWARPSRSVPVDSESSWSLGVTSCYLPSSVSVTLPDRCCHSGSCHTRLGARVT